MVGPFEPAANGAAYARVETHRSTHDLPRVSRDCPKVILDKKKNMIALENFDLQPVLLTQVKRTASFN